MKKTLTLSNHKEMLNILNLSAMETRIYWNRLKDFLKNKAAKEAGTCWFVETLEKELFKGLKKDVETRLNKNFKHELDNATRNINKSLNW